jgi:hypothetical protein
MDHTQIVPEPTKDTVSLSSQIALADLIQQFSAPSDQNHRKS